MGRAEGSVSCVQFGFANDFSQPTMHSPPLRWVCTRVDAPGQQWVGESKPLALDRHDSFAFGVLQQFDNAVDTEASSSGHDLHRRRADTGRSQQRVAGDSRKAAYTGLDQLRDAAW